MQSEQTISRRRTRIIQRRNSTLKKSTRLGFTKTGLQISILLGAIILVVSITVAVFSPVLKVQQINVEGIKLTELQQIQEITPRIGKWMPTLKSGQVSSEISALPMIESVKILRIWPNTVRIIVTELTPKARWVQGGKSYLVSENGIVLQALIESKTKLPKIIGTSQFPLQPGEKVNIEAIKTALLIPDLLANYMNKELTEIRDLPGVGISIRTTDGKTILIGNTENLEHQISIWQQISAKAKENNIQYTEIDLRFQNHPVLRNIQKSVKITSNKEQ